MSNSEEEDLWVPSWRRAEPSHSQRWSALVFAASEKGRMMRALLRFMKASGGSRPELLMESARIGKDGDLNPCLL